MLRSERTTTLLAAFICVAIGVLIATLPHLLAYQTHGDPVWIADSDEIFYLQVGSQALLNHPYHLADPALAASGKSIYKPLPLLPGVLIAHALGLAPIQIGLCWRVWAGLTIGLAWFILTRRLLGSSWKALALSVLLMVDGGIAEGRPFLSQGDHIVHLLKGDTAALFHAKPILQPAWRISTPGVTMAYLALLIWAVSKARERPTQKNLALAGVAFGLLFHLYFYYWTAVTIALCLAWMLDRGHRRLYFHVGWIGILVGMPSLLADVVTKRTTAPDWLLRSDKFLPIGHFSELLLPKLAMLVTIALGWVVWRHRRDLLFLWCLVLAGLGLMNHQVITGLQIENFHWHYVWGPSLSLLILLLLFGWLTPALERSKMARAVLWFVVVAMTASGFWLRGLEANRSHDSRELSNAYRAFVLPPAEMLPPNATVAGSRLAVDLCSIMANVRPLDSYAVRLSSTLRDGAWIERRALNAHLNGLSREAFEASERQSLATDAWGPWARDGNLQSVQLARRMEAYDRAEADMVTLLNRWNVRTLIDPFAPPPPASPLWQPAPGPKPPRVWIRSH